MTCCSVSSMLAPGHPAWTIMVRKVKGGSSARPRLKNEAMPASVTAAMMKTMKERCFSAQSERLSELTKSLRGAAPSGPDAAPGRPPSPPRRRARAPDEMTAVAGSKRCNLDIAQRNGQVLRIDDPHRRLSVDRGQRARRNRNAGAALELQPARSPWRRDASPRDDR